MKLIVTTAAHGIDTGEYTGDTLSQLLQAKRHSVTSLVARGQARWQHEDSALANDPAHAVTTPADPAEDYD